MPSAKPMETVVFPSPESGGIDGRHQHELAAAFGAVDGQLRLIFAVPFDVRLRKPQLGGDFADILHFAVLSDLDITQHVCLLAAFDFIYCTINRRTLQARAKSSPCIRPMPSSPLIRSRSRAAGADPAGRAEQIPLPHKAEPREVYSPLIPRRDERDPFVQALIDQRAQHQLLLRTGGIAIQLSVPTQPAAVAAGPVRQDKIKPKTRLFFQ